MIVHAHSAWKTSVRGGGSGHCFDAAFVAECHSDVNGGYAAMNDLLSRGGVLDAVFCFKDHMAMGAYDAIEEHWPADSP